MKLTSAEASVVRTSLIDQDREIGDRMKTLEFHLKAHKVDPKTSEILKYYAEARKVLKKVQGALLTTGTIEYEGELS